MLVWSRTPMRFGFQLLGCGSLGDVCQGTKISLRWQISPILQAQTQPAEQLASGRESWVHNDLVDLIRRRSSEILVQVFLQCASTSGLECSNCLIRCVKKIQGSAMPKTSILVIVETFALMMTMSTTIPQSPLPIIQSFLFAHSPAPFAGQAVFRPVLSP